MISPAVATPLVSIIIRARDEAPALRRLLPLLRGQQTDFPFEIWLLDNASRDDSAAIARAHGCRYHHIPQGGFNYAGALNTAAALADGTILVHLSAHCFPQHDGWLAALVAPLRADDAVIASYGRQWSDPQTNPFEATGNDDLFPAHGTPRTLAFSNANCAVRRQIVLLHPFNPAVKIMEDHLFALELTGEHPIVYVPDAVVTHAHTHFSWRGYVRRWVREGWAMFFLSRHRGLSSPFVPTLLIDPRAWVLGYPRVALALARRGRWRLALICAPFFWLRDSVWLAGFIRARAQHPLLARLDTGHLTRVNRALLGMALRGGATSDDGAPVDWPEEWRLKADWSFIREQIAHFIRECHETGMIRSPLLEVGASGQNDYLAEWYTMTTSNLAFNMQGAAAPLDMEDMHGIADGSVGTVLCSEVIEHVQHPDRAIAEAFRVLRTGGTLIITTPYSIIVHDTADDGGFHGRNFTLQGLELVLREAGFQIIRGETRGRTAVRRRLMPSNVFVVGQKPA